jgi:hypothetical protein
VGIPNHQEDSTVDRVRHREYSGLMSEQHGGFWSSALSELGRPFSIWRFTGEFCSSIGAAIYAQFGGKALLLYVGFDSLRMTPDWFIAVATWTLLAAVSGAIEIAVSKHQLRPRLTVSYDETRCFSKDVETVVFNSHGSTGLPFGEIQNFQLGGQLYSATSSQPSYGYSGTHNRVKAIYVGVLVENTKGTEAENCRGSLRAVEHKERDSGEYRNLLNTNLSLPWSPAYESDGEPIDIPGKQKEVLDVCYVNEEGKLGLHTRNQPSGTAEKLSAPGIYRFTIRISSKSAQAVIARLCINWDGKTTLKPNNVWIDS